MQGKQSARAAHATETKGPDLLRNYRKLAIPAVIAAMMPDNEAARQGAEPAEGRERERERRSARR
jgi:hypothetical protein